MPGFCVGYRSGFCRRQWRTGLTLGSPRRSATLTLLPLLHSHLPVAPDTLLDEAMSREDFEIVEQGSGTVLGSDCPEPGCSDVPVH
jgi:hypothetical protein